MYVSFFLRIVRLNKVLLWLGAILLSLGLTQIVTSTMSYYFFGRVTQDYLITGLVASFLVAAVVSGIVIVLVGVLNSLDRSNAHLNNILNCCPVPMAVNDQRHNILMLNPEFTRVFGYSASELPNLDEWWPKAYPDASYRQWVIDEWSRRLRDMGESGRFEQLEVRICCRDGTVRTVLASATPLDGVESGMSLVVLFDITESADVLKALDESRSLLRSIIETIPLRVFWKDRDSRYMGCNTAFALDSGATTPAEIVGKRDEQLGWKDQASLYQADDQHVMRLRQSKLAYEEPQTTPDGREIWLRTSKLPLENANGEVIGVLGVYEDVTERRKVENKLWLTQAIIDKSKTAFFRLSPEGRVDYVNEFACRSLGYTRDELLGMYPWQFDPDFNAQQWSSVWETLCKTGTVNLETRLRRKDGSLFNVDVTGHYIAFNGEEFSFTFVQDISDRVRVETALREKERYQRALIDNFPFEVWLKDTQSRFLSVNHVFAKTFGAQSADDLIGKTDFDIAPKTIAEAYRADDRQVMITRQRKTVEEVVVDQYGQSTWVETYKAPVVDAMGDLLGTVGFFRDISARKLAETELRIAATAFESQEGMVITDANTVILKVNRSFTEITGFTAEQAVGQRMTLLKSGVHDDAFYAAMWGSIAQIGSWQGEIWNRRQNGELYPEWLTITAVRNQSGIVTHYVGTMIDVTARKAVEQQMEYLAHHDPLTDLPNRLLLSDRLQLAIAQAHREQHRLAILYLDLDRFKPVNDNLGHEVGDQLLKAVALRIGQCVRRESDTLARLGGDEFLVLLAPVEKRADAAVVAENILRNLNEPFEINGHTISISCSIGVALYPQDGQESIRLLRHADQAMYEAKHAGASCIKYFSEEE